MQGAANTIFQQFFPKFYKNEGLKSFFFMACSMFLVVFVWFPYPGDQEGPLEEMDPLFGGTSHVQNGAILLQQSKEGALDVEQRRGEKVEIEVTAAERAGKYHVQWKELDEHEGNQEQQSTASYTTWRMDLDNSTAAALSVNRGALDFYVSYACVNLRDQIRHGDPLDTPLQYANLWNYAAEAAWQNPRLCVANSTTTINPTQSLYPPSSTPGEPQPTKTSIQSSVHLSDEEEDVEVDKAALDHDDPTNDILAYSRPMGRIDGRPCKSVHDCGPQFDCVSVPVRENGKDTKRPLCLAHCNRSRGNWCPSGYQCKPTNGVTADPQHVTGHQVRFLPGVCNSITPLSFDDKPSTEGALFSTLAVDKDTIPNNAAAAGSVDSSSSCMDNISGFYYLHCFRQSSSLQRCLVFHDGFPRLDPYPVYCHDGELQKWIDRKDVRFGVYDPNGSKAYWEIPNSKSPHLVVYHTNTEYNFRADFDPRNPLGLLVN
ncbi:hypothetical protein BJX68DRAFT_265542 [Aspergillus pseudodeflectus]|uniref:Uncharacterized protein n=1 Tax=Aspergillus pseudodeflectus TaxID=176178 RepID=A0ABR4KK55_9EURO